MTDIEKLTYVIAYGIGKKYNESAETILEKMNEYAKILNKANKGSTGTEASKEDIDYLYGLYPTKCPIQGRSTGKGAGDKKKIAILLRKWTVKALEEYIKDYLSDCAVSKTYLKNFSTFLNMIPSEPAKDAESIPLDQTSIYQ